MKAEVIQYHGFIANADGREYRFQVIEKGGERTARIVTLQIPANYFRPGMLTFQQGPDIASRKLQTMLAGENGSPLMPRQTLSESDVAEYAAASKKQGSSVNESRKVRGPRTLTTHEDGIGSGYPARIREGT